MRILSESLKIHQLEKSPNESEQRASKTTRSGQLRKTLQLVCCRPCPTRSRSPQLTKHLRALPFCKPTAKAGIPNFKQLERTLHPGRRNCSVLICNANRAPRWLTHWEMAFASSCQAGHQGNFCSAYRKATSTMCCSPGTAIAFGKSHAGTSPDTKFSADNNTLAQTSAESAMESSVPISDKHVRTSEFAERTASMLGP